jgi:hypothetical protein
LNYGGLRVSEAEFYEWDYSKIDRIHERMLTQKKAEEAEIRKISSKRQGNGNIRRR